MEDRIIQLKEIIKVLRKEVVSKQVKYETDEEKLERETGWHVRTADRKKRKANSSPENFPLQVITIDKNNNDYNKKKYVSIFMSSVKNFNILKETTLQGAKNDINIKTIANNEIKINTITMIFALLFNFLNPLKLR